MIARLVAAVAICTTAPMLVLAPTAHAESATVVGEASCLYGGPSWMSSWSVSSTYPFSVYGAGLERTHQFDEDTATLEVLVNVGSATAPQFEVVSTTIARPDGCDGTTPPAEPVGGVEPIGARTPVTATVVGEASCLYGGPSWMSSWSVSSTYPFSVYGAGLERTHQFDEDTATLEVLVNVGSATAPQFEVVSTTIARPDGCDGTTPPAEPVVDTQPSLVADPVVESEPPVEQTEVLAESEPPAEQAELVLESAPLVEATLPRANDDGGAERRHRHHGDRGHRALHHRSVDHDDDDRRDGRDSSDRSDRDDRKDRSASSFRHRPDARG